MAAGSAYEDALLEGLVWPNVRDWARGTGQGLDKELGYDKDKTGLILELD